MNIEDLTHIHIYQFLTFINQFNPPDQQVIFSSG
jgi:hypothetical protein